jgi:hypothetical protein
MEEISEVEIWVFIFFYSIYGQIKEGNFLKRKKVP